MKGGKEIRNWDLRFNHSIDMIVISNEEGQKLKILSQRLFPVELLMRYGDPTELSQTRHLATDYNAVIYSAASIKLTVLENFNLILNEETNSELRTLYRRRNRRDCHLNAVMRSVEKFMKPLFRETRGWLQVNLLDLEERRSTRLEIPV